MFSYVDFEVELVAVLRHGAATELRVIARCELTGDAEAREPVRAAELDRLPEDASAVHQANPRNADVRHIGDVLGRVLLPGPVGQLFRRAYRALRPDQGLRLRLRLTDDLLIRCPWEFIRFDLVEGDPGPLLADERISVVRHVRSEAVAPRLLPPAELTILSVDAGRVRPTAPLDEELPDPFDVAGLRPYRLVRVRHATVGRLADALAQHRPAVFHFSGHGQPPTEESDGVLVMHHPQGGEALLGGAQLGSLLAAHGVSVAVLSACFSAEHAVQPAATAATRTGVTQALLAAGIPIVVAMQYAVEEGTARRFTAALVTALVAGATVDEAVARGRRELLNGLDVDFARPVTHQRSVTGAFVEPFQIQDLGEADVPAERSWTQLQRRGRWWRVEAVGDEMSLHRVPDAGARPVAPTPGNSVHLAPDGTAAVLWREGSCRVAWLNRLEPRLVEWREPVAVLHDRGSLLAVTTAGASALRLAISTGDRTLEVRIGPHTPPRTRVVADEPSRAAAFLGGQLVTVSPSGTVRDLPSGPPVPGLASVTSLDAADVGGRTLLAAVGRDDGGTPRLAVLVGGRLVQLSGLPAPADLVVVSRGASSVRGPGGIVTASGAGLRLHEFREQISR